MCPSGLSIPSPDSTKFRTAVPVTKWEDDTFNSFTGFHEMEGRDSESCRFVFQFLHRIPRQALKIENFRKSHFQFLHRIPPNKLSMRALKVRDLSIPSPDSTGARTRPRVAGFSLLSIPSPDSTPQQFIALPQRRLAVFQFLHRIPHQAGRN